MGYQIIGRKFGSFTATKTIGRGIDSSVETVLGRNLVHYYRAADEATNRQAVMRLVRAEPAQQDVFLRETETLMTLDHPSITPIYEYGVDDGICYLTTQFLGGMNLNHLLSRVKKDGRLLSYPRMLQIIRDTGEILDYLHKQGFVHYNLTPASLLARKEGTVLTNLKAIKDQTDFDPIDVGNIYYISPEQARTLTVTPDSNFYTLGIILYEMLVGTVPFSGDSPVALAVKHISDMPPSPRKLNPTISPEIEAVITKAIAKKPENRYRSGRALADALEAAFAVSRDPSFDTPIFISYKRTDWDGFVNPLLERLHAEGFQTWVDQHLLEGGEDWMDEINNALRDCERMILCVSPEALQSRHVKLEYRYFFNNGKTIYPLMCRETILPAELQTIQFFPYTQLDALIELLKRG